MADVPVVGGDKNTWGTKLNTFLNVALETSGANGGRLKHVESNLLLDDFLAVAHETTGANAGRVKDLSYDYYPDPEEIDQGVTGGGNTIKAFIDAIGADVRSIALTSGVFTLSTNLTIPENITLVIFPAATIEKGVTATLTINSRFEAGRYQVFSNFNAGDIIFGSKSVREVIPQWFGVIADGSDETDKIQACISSVSGIAGKVYFQEGTYGATGISVPDGAFIDLYGSGDKSILKHLASGSALLSSAGTITDFNAHNLLFDGNQVNQTNWETRTLHLKVDKCSIEYCTFTGGVHSSINFSDIITKATINRCHFSGMREHDGVSGHDTSIVLVNGSQSVSPEIHFTNNFCYAAVDTLTPALETTTPGGFIINYDYPTYSDQIRAVVRNNTFINIGQSKAGNFTSPIHFYTDVTNAVIDGNVILNTGYRAIQAQRSQNVTISNNIIDGTRYICAAGDNDAAIHISNRATATGTVFPRTNYNICNNIVKNMATFIGIRVVSDTNKYCGQVLINDNTIDTAAAGIMVSYTDGEVVIGNNIIRNLDRLTYSSIYKGIYVYDVGHNVSVINNQISYSDEAFAAGGGRYNQGIFVERLPAIDDQPCIIKGNIVRQCADNVISVRNMVVNITDNIVQDLSVYAYDVQNCIYANLSNNYAENGAGVNATNVITFGDTNNTWVPKWLSPSQITSEQNDYDPNSWNRLRLTSDTSRDITGIAARPVGGLLTIVNTGSFNIVLKHQSTSSLAANRIISQTGADITLSANQLIELIYDTTSSRWRDR